MVKRISSLFLLLLVFASELVADVTVAKIFTSHMVLQQEKAVLVWGTASSTENVIVTLGGNEAKTTADPTGNWRVELPSMKAGGPYKMTIRGKNTVTLEDILVGEVWLCSGQSNMHMALKDGRGGVLNYKEEIKNANHPRIRLLQVPNGRDKIDMNFAWRWIPSTPESTKGFSATAYFFARHLHKELGVPVGVINASQGGSRIQPWLPGGNLFNTGGNLFNKCITHFVGLPVRGFLWYQGENNVDMGLEYEAPLRKLIAGWRTQWKDEKLPFYYAQLAPYISTPVNLPLLWDAQRRCLDIPNTMMIGTSDISTLTNIHPPNKQEVGRRFALVALQRSYGKKDIVGTGPIYRTMKKEGNKIRVLFDHAEGGLKSGDGDPLWWIQIAGADKKFVWADAKIDGETLLVWSDKVKKPEAVRVGWHGMAEHNLANAAGLPALPFRTDNWQGNKTTHANSRMEISIPSYEQKASLGEVRNRLSTAPVNAFSLGGRTIGELRVARMGECLAVLADIYDIRVNSTTKEWEGLVFELYASGIGTKTVRQLVVQPNGIPNKGAVRAYEMGKKTDLPDCTWDVRALEKGYSICLLAPLDFFGIPLTDKEFLLESAVTTTWNMKRAASWMSLFGSYGAFRNNQRFAKVTIQE